MQQKDFLTNNSKNIILIWPLSLLHAAIFFFNMILSHIPLVIARLFGQRTMDQFLAIHCLIHVLNIKLLGTKIFCLIPKTIPLDKPLIVISNHQSMYDVPLIIWHLRQHRPKFIAKIELARWIPTISFTLRNGSHPLIDRKDGRSAVDSIKSYAKKAAINNGTICIFPEGTRSKLGHLRPFKIAGFAALHESMPEATIIFLAIDGTGTITKKRLIPAPLSVPLLIKVSDPIDKNNKTPEQIIKEAETWITKEIKEFRENLS